MAEPLRHRQTKEAETDMFSLQPPRHISTLPDSVAKVLRKKQKHFPTSKGLIWLMFHALQVRQGPMEN